MNRASQVQSRSCKSHPTDEQRGNSRETQPCRTSYCLPQPHVRKCTDRKLRQDCHDNKRPVWMLRAHPVNIGFFRVWRHFCRESNARGRDAVVSRRKSRRVRACRVLTPPLLGVDDLDLNRRLWTSVHARRRLRFLEPAIAHVAFADDATFRTKLRDTIRTVPRAVLTSNAGV